MSSGLKRQFDTIMNTVHSRAEEPDIPLELRGDIKEIGRRETRVEVGELLATDKDSEKATLFERTLVVTYETTDGSSASSLQQSIQPGK